jgi:hypothetical protein
MAKTIKSKTKLSQGLSECFKCDLFLKTRLMVQRKTRSRYNPEFRRRQGAEKSCKVPHAAFAKSAAAVKRETGTH